MLQGDTVAAIVTDAGGQVVGRTRLQKIAYILHAAGLCDVFSFSYKHFGPYSEELANTARQESLLGTIMEQEHTATWGGSYSIYVATQPRQTPGDTARARLARIANSANAIELELAATAVFLSREGHSDPWKETAQRKPEKADEGRLDRAKSLLEALRAVEVPQPLPVI